MNAATGSEAPLPDDGARAARTDLATDPGDGAEVPRPALVRYALGSCGMGVYVTVPGLLLLYFLTDTLGVTPWLAGLALLVPKARTSSCTRSSAPSPTGNGPGAGTDCGC